MHFTLPKLPYGYAALEPYIDKTTMTLHHDKHHAGYVSKLNAALEQIPSHRDMPLTDLLRDLNSLPPSAFSSVKNNGGGHFNHSLFWRVLSPDGGGEPSGRLAEELERDFESVDKFKETFTASAMNLFGSGWTWLCCGSDSRLVIENTANQDTPIVDRVVPILGIDLWEHAYYLKYQNRRADYIEAFWHIVDWHQVSKNFELAHKNGVLTAH